LRANSKQSKQGQVYFLNIELEADIVPLWFALCV
jgi:hypothetical protein